MKIITLFLMAVLTLTTACTAKKGSSISGAPSLIPADLIIAPTSIVLLSGSTTVFTSGDAIGASLFSITSGGGSINDLSG
jgi:hypothetical protein